MNKTNNQLQLSFSEVDEVSFEDLQAASDKFDDIKANPKKYFKQPDNSKIISSLRKSAESCIKQAEKINTEVSGNWTYRRQRFADNAQKKKDGLLKNATALNRLADLWETNDCPEILKGIRSVSDFDAYYPRQIEKDDEWFKEEHPKLLKKALKVGLKMQSDNEPFKEAIKQLQEIVLTPEQEQQIKLKEALKEVHKMNIPGFFPTPDDVIDKMIEYACIEDGTRILEPSAGIGNICDIISKRYPTCELTCCEQQYSLSAILKLKGYNVVSNDIFDMVKIYEFNRILMNPPFEKGQDVDHVMHCFKKFLKYDGILVSIMSAGVLSNTNSKYVEFREFVAQNGGEFIQLGQAFKNAFNSTGTSVIILKLTK